MENNQAPAEEKFVRGRTYARNGLYNRRLCISANSRVARLMEEDGNIIYTPQARRFAFREITV